MGIAYAFPQSFHETRVGIASQNSLPMFTLQKHKHFCTKNSKSQDVFSRQTQLLAITRFIATTIIA
jgi:hypothetical protein